MDPLAWRRLLLLSLGWPEPDHISGNPSRSHKQLSRGGGEASILVASLPKEVTVINPKHLPWSRALFHTLVPALPGVLSGGCESGTKPHPTPETPAPQFPAQL